MKQEQIKDLGGEKFRRLTGIKPETFEKMFKILSDADRKKKSRGGRRNKLNLKDQLFVTLEYIREYRTYFHIGKSYDISESTVYKTVRWVEDTLIKHPAFALPGRKELINNNYDTILIDATETPIERPKKGRRSSTPAKRKAYLQKPSNTR